MGSRRISTPFHSFMLQGPLTIAGPNDGQYPLMLTDMKNIKIQLEVPIVRLPIHTEKIYSYFFETNGNAQKIGTLEESHRTEDHIYFERSIQIIGGTTKSLCTKNEANHICMSAIDWRSGAVEVWQTSVVIQHGILYLRTQKIASGNIYINSEAEFVVKGLSWYQNIGKHLLAKDFLNDIKASLLPHPQEKTPRNHEANTGVIVTWNEAYGCGIMLTEHGHALVHWENLCGDTFRTGWPEQKLAYKSLERIGSTPPFTACIYRATEIRPIASAAPDINHLSSQHPSLPKLPTST